MKIVHVHKYFYERAGAERYLFDVMAAQEAGGHCVIPFAMEYPKNIPSAWSSYWVSGLDTEKGTHGWRHALKLFGRALWSREAEKKMRQLLRDTQPDIVHVHNIYTHLSPSILRACKREGVPVVMTVHDYALISANYSLWGGEEPLATKPSWLAVARSRYIKGSFLATAVLDAIYRLHRWMHIYRDGIYRFIVPSEFVKGILVENGFAEESMAVMPLFTSAHPKLDSENFSNDVLFAGRLERYKGAHVLIEAMKDYPHASLVIAGSGSQDAALREQANDMLNVQFLGHISSQEVWNRMAKARVVVVPSLWPEIFGLTALGAMACGSPIIVSDQGTLPEIVDPGVTGVVFHVEDGVDGLTRALEPFVTQNGYSEDMRESARMRAKEIGDKQAYISQLQEIYEEAISSVDKV